ncbi:hypothetical protein CCZ01_03695 [Helicobacter monodelphidis]|uniref:tetratricopeptide repeat protein n=1 Tax=Helicobacter sp. 15-1451 TaxID=2004995 RepID=UPI000DCAEC72|nr:tetratricopeptide repeat protein [Helicobacter sp. 15-1451]RAX58188.1 hypothetical protein CCZ01_03695 [Helicobacter sp. 15-1451]
MKNYIIGVIACASVSFLVAEPSMFSAAEKKKNAEQEMRKELFNLFTTVKSIQESQEGLQSLFDSHTKKLQEIYIKNKESPFVTHKFLQERESEINSTIAEFKVTLNDNFKQYDENFDKISGSLEALGILIQDINAQQKKEIVSMQEQIVVLQQQIKDIEVKAREGSPKEKLEDSKQSSQKKDSKEIKETQEEIQKVDLKTMKKADVYKEAVAFYSKSDYESAKSYFTYCYENNYKPATSSYYLGEIAFKGKQYEDAIRFYKESATRYDKASYMPNLLLHTAESFVFLKDSASAKKFFDTLISLYPNSKEAKVAKQSLAKMK